tara:strand:- start:13040 stop:14695 length:1656 start_codon:yes stop_codon:yes gene_type:complete
MNVLSDNNISALLNIIKPSLADELATETQCPLTDVASTEDWISQLSATNYADNAVQLYRVLPSLVRLDTDPSDKMAILDSLAPTVARCADCLLQTQLRADSAKAISLGQALMRLVYEGYKLVIFQLGTALQRDNQQQTKKLAKAIFNACNVLAKIQLNSLSHYLAQPPYFWRELHCLNLLAERLNIHDMDIPSATGINTSISKVYLKLLLFNCTRPNHFSHYEMMFVYTELDFWAPLAELQKGSKGGLFAIDPSSNRGAVYADEIDPSSPYVTLDTFNLVKFLNSTLEETNSALFSDRVSRRVIKDLVRQWGTKIKRRETHIKDKIEVSIASGFTSSVCMLSRTDSFENFLLLCGQKPSRAEQGVRGIKRVDDAWGTSFEAIDSHPADPVIYTPTRAKKTKLSLIRGMRTDISLNGCCIELPREESELKPGEVVAIRVKGSSKWQVGIIRWKHTSPSLTALCGIQFPSRFCAAAAIQSGPSDAQGQQHFVHGILLSKKKDMSDQLSLLCPPLRYHKGSKIRLLSTHKKMRVILGEELDSTEHLTHFKITPC